MTKYLYTNMFVINSGHLENLGSKYSKYLKIHEHVS